MDLEQGSASPGGRGGGGAGGEGRVVGLQARDIGMGSSGSYGRGSLQISMRHSRDISDDALSLGGNAIRPSQDDSRVGRRFGRPTLLEDRYNDTNYWGGLSGFGITMGSPVVSDEVTRSSSVGDGGAGSVGIDGDGDGEDEDEMPMFESVSDFVAWRDARRHESKGEGEDEGEGKA